MIWILCILTLLLSSCGPKPQERHYTEIVDQAPQTNFSSSPKAAMFSWDLPQGWEEVAGGQMRLATFHLIADPTSMDCSVTALAGHAGGMDANVGRWLGQLGLEASDDHLKMLNASKQIVETKDGLEVSVFDFTSLQAHGNPSDKSMVAAMIDLDQTTVFVKMTGSIEVLRQNKDSFLKLIGSIRRNG